MDFKGKIENFFSKVKKEDLFFQITSFLEKNSEEYKINGFNKNDKKIIFYYEKNKTEEYILKEHQC